MEALSPARTKLTQQNAGFRRQFGTRTRRKGARCAYLADPPPPRVRTSTPTAVHTCSWMAVHV